MTEELKIIMETIAQLGQAGKEAFIWWLIVKYALHYFTVMAFIAGVVVAARMIVGRVTSMSHGNQLGTELTKLLGMPSDYGQGWSNEYRRGEVKAEIINKVRDLVASKKP